MKTKKNTAEADNEYHDRLNKIVEDLGFGNYVNVSKVITYDVVRIVEHLLELHKGNREYVPTYHEIIDTIVEYVKDDFSCGHGHVADLGDLIFTNEEGDDL